MTTVSIPPISQALIDSNNQMVKEWYDKIKFIEKLQPLADIVFPASGVTSIDATTGAFTLDYGITRSSQALKATLTTGSSAISGDVALNNTANYFDGPSVNLGTTGTWFVHGTVTVLDTAATAAIYAKLWDGTTVISSAAGVSANTTRGVCISLSGIITSPAANVKISCRDVDAATGKILFNQTGNSKDSHITAVRIA